MLSMDCTHPEILDFINIKTDLDKVTKANISVRVSDDFMNAVENDEDWELYFKTEHEEIKKIVKAKEVFKLLCKNNWDYAEPGILFWDRINNYNILSEDDEFEYAGVNPCAEEPLPNGGSCLLGALNLSAYVENGEFNYKLFKEDVHVAVKGLNEVLDEGLPLHPLQIQRDTVRDYRQIGLGVMGIADMLIKMGVKYDSDRAQELCDTIGYILANEALKASALLSIPYGPYPKYNKEAVSKSEFVLNNTNGDVYDLIEECGLRNSQVLTIAPTGSISTMIEVSGGIEPIFSFSYTRKTESLHGEDKYYKVYTKIVKEYMEENGLEEEEELPDFFVNAQTIDPFKRVEMQGIWQSHIDASISSTVNLPNEATVEEVEELYMEAWRNGLKGMTIYRDGCARSGVLTINDKKEEEKVEDKNEIPRGFIVPTNDNVIGLKRKIKGGCGSLHIQVYFDTETGKMTEVFVNKGGTGGCNSNLNALSRMISLALRGGIDIKDIADQLDSTINCPSFASSRAKGITLSPGSSCASAVGKALIDLNKEFQKMFKHMILAEDEEEVEEEYVEMKNEITKHEFSKEELKFLKENDEVDFVNKYQKCPVCGNKIAHSGGCISCVNGCWSKCE